MTINIVDSTTGTPKAFTKKMLQDLDIARKHEQFSCGITKINN